MKLLISKAVRVLANHRIQHAMKTFRLYSCFLLESEGTRQRSSYRSRLAA